ncbi:MAG TPA: FAD:protein FMN transferase [Pirellulales bacterium]|jgi:thiamine biosynthesis lipoprotein|nr:FAD:protein FMN transferase [Pirellulales bacterium]
MNSPSHAEIDSHSPAAAPPGGMVRVRRQWQAMATRLDVELVGADVEHLEAVAAAIEDETHRLDALLSRFKPASEISRLNRRAADEAVRVDADLWQLLCQAEHFRRATDGFFDVAAASAAAAELKNGTGSEQRRASAETNAGREVPVPIFQHAGQHGAPRLQLDAARQTVRFASAGVVVDLGAIGKGFVLDRAKEILARYGVERALVSAGTSSILAVGRPAPGTTWMVDVRHPLDDGANPIAQLELVDQSLSCSATLRPGQAESDIVDPHTGLPLAGGEAVVVLAPTGTEAEALSTALLAMGRGRAAEYLARGDSTKSLSESPRGLSQFCAVRGAKWDCPPLPDGSRIDSKVEVAWIDGASPLPNPQRSNPQCPNLDWLIRSHD